MNPDPPDSPLGPLEARLRRGLAGNLPGPAAHTLMSPRPRPGWKAGEIPEHATDAAGLLLLFPDTDANPNVLLTVRSRHLPTHKGQVSLPGGMVEDGETLREAALREAHEEAGVDPGEVRVLGELTPLFIPVSGFVLHPFVGVADRRPGLRPESGEVERILEVGLDTLADPTCLGRVPRSLLQIQRMVPFFDLDGETVWGATAMVLAEFLALLGTPPDPWSGPPAAEPRPLP